MKAGGIVFALEAVIMLSMYILPLELEEWQEITFDALVLGLMAPLLICYSILYPALREKKDIDGDDRKANLQVPLLTYFGISIVIYLLMMASY